MDIGLVLQTDPPASHVIEVTRQAEDAGFTHVWTFESCVLWEDTFVIFPAMLAATSKVIVGPMVTNPVQRDWTVIASMFATMNEMFGDRTICGIGRGDSALRVIGGQPISMKGFAESITTIKDLAEGREAIINGKPIRIPWAGASKLPMWGAGYGPKALQVIGELADGFILQTADPVITRWVVETVREAARSAGRDPAAITICVAAPAYVGDNVAHQRDQLRWFGGMVGNHVADIVARYGYDSEVPHELTDYIKDRQGYDYSHHGRADNPSVNFVPDNIIDRFCIVGPAENHIARLTELAELGVDQFALYLMHDSADATLKAYGDTVIPAVRNL
jgi:probable F420-dependent oxidoreductase